MTSPIIPGVPAQSDFEWTMRILEMIPPEHRMQPEPPSVEEAETEIVATPNRKLAKGGQLPEQEQKNKQKQTNKRGKDSQASEQNHNASFQDNTQETRDHLPSSSSSSTPDDITTLDTESSGFTFGAMQTDTGASSQQSNRLHHDISAKEAAQEASRQLNQVPKSEKLARLRHLETELEHLNPEARHAVEEQLRMENAARRARGEQPLKTSKTMKKKLEAKRRRKNKSTTQWEQRQQQLESKQQRRAERKQENVENARLGFRGRRPGFEGKYTQPLNRRNKKNFKNKNSNNNNNNNSKQDASNNNNNRNKNK